MNEWEFETVSIHAGFDKDGVTGATSVPVYQTAAFAYDTAGELHDVFRGKKFGYVYSRIANPTVAALENKINAMEQGMGAVVTSSGMSAIATVVFTLTASGDRILASKSIFAGTVLFFNTICKKYGIHIDYIDITDTAAVRNSIGRNTKCIFAETIGNPRLDVSDVYALAEIAGGADIPLVLDSTVTTPYLFPSKKYGVAVVIHSMTKYLTGNGSSLGGVVVDLGNYDWRTTKIESFAPFIEKAGDMAFLVAARKHVVQNIGVNISPFNAFLQNLGTETLPLRMERHCANALELAEFLEKHPKVTAAHYPGLGGNPFRELARRQFDDRYGGMITLQLGTKEKCFHFIANLRLAKNLANLGDAKTLVIHPSSTIYGDFTDEEKKTFGVSVDLIRISVGLENIKDIINDFDRALREVD